MDLRLQLDSISTPITEASVITDPSGHFKPGDRVTVKEEHQLRFNRLGQGYYPVTITSPEGHILHARRHDATASVESSWDSLTFPTPRQSTQLYELMMG